MKFNKKVLFGLFAVTIALASFFIPEWLRDYPSALLLSFMLFVSITIFTLIVGFLLNRKAEAKGFLKILWLSWITIPALCLIFFAAGERLYPLIMPPPATEVVTIENFTFENYIYKPFNPVLLAALRKILPAGTPRSEVEDFLVTKHGAQETIRIGNELITYEHKAAIFTPDSIAPWIFKGPFYWEIEVQYDKQQKLTQVRLVEVKSFEPIIK